MAKDPKDPVPAQALDPGASEAPAHVKVTVIGPKTGRRRAGFVFNGDPQPVEVTEAQLEKLRADPALAVIKGWPEPAAS